MTRCPACGADSERIYRCSECGTDLVDVDEDDDEDRSPLAVTDGGHPPGATPNEEHPEPENELVDRAIDEAVELVQEGDSVQVAVDYVVDDRQLKHRAAEIYQRVREEVDSQGGDGP